VQLDWAAVCTISVLALSRWTETGLVLCQFVKEACRHNRVVLWSVLGSVAEECGDLARGLNEVPTPSAPSCSGVPGVVCPGVVAWKLSLGVGRTVRTRKFFVRGLM
jgi:hypothetical protein